MSNCPDGIPPRPPVPPPLYQLPSGASCPPHAYYPSQYHAPPAQVTVERDNSTIATIMTVIACLVFTPVLFLAAIVAGAVVGNPVGITLLMAALGAPTAVGFSVPAIYRWCRKHM